MVDELREARAQLAEAARLLEQLSAADRAFVEDVARQEESSSDLELSSLVSHGSQIVDGRFRKIVFSAYHAKNVDLRGLEGLRGFAVDYAPELVELDVRGVDQLDTLLCRGAKLRKLRLGGNANLRRLDCADSRFETIRLAEAPNLRELNISGTRVRELVVPANLELLECRGLKLESLKLVPNLRFLDCAWNRLKQLELREAPRLEVLHASSNRLRALNTAACPRLISLSAFGNRFRAIDLSRNPRLVSVDLSDNRLKVLDVSKNTRLLRLDCSNNRLAHLNVSRCRVLQVLHCPKNRLARLELGKSPYLWWLELQQNPLSALDLSGASSLRTLTLGDNRFASVDVRPCWQLAEVGAGDDDERLSSSRIVATKEQRRRFAANRLGGRLWDRLMLPRWKSPHALHRWIVEVDWEEEGYSVRLDVIRMPQCDLGTALSIYWANAPGYLAQYETREQAVAARHGKEWDLMTEIESRVLAGAYQSACIPYDPLNDDGVDMTRRYRDHPARREIPARMRERSVDGPGPRARASSLPDELEKAAGWRAFRDGSKLPAGVMTVLR